jgi:hypothetical protein
MNAKFSNVWLLLTDIHIFINANFSFLEWVKRHGV